MSNQSLCKQVNNLFVIYEKCIIGSFWVYMFRKSEKFDLIPDCNLGMHACIISMCKY